MYDGFFSLFFKNCCVVDLQCCINFSVQQWFIQLYIYMGFPAGSDGEESACNSGDPGSIPGEGRSPGEGNGNPLQYSCLENSRDRGAWWATADGVLKSQTGLSNFPSYIHI